MTNVQGFTASALAFAVGMQELRKDDTKSGRSLTVEQASLHIVRRLNPGSLKTGDGGVRGPARVTLYANAAKKTVGKRETVREPCASLPCCTPATDPCRLPCAGEPGWRQSGGGCRTATQAKQAPASAICAKACGGA